jgi:hypothetical protein
MLRVGALFDNFLCAIFPFTNRNCAYRPNDTHDSSFRMSQEVYSMSRATRQGPRPVANGGTHEANSEEFSL